MSRSRSAGEGGNRVVVLHGAVPPDSPPDELDVLEEVRAVSRALEGLGWAAEPLPLTLDLETAKESLGRWRPALVFNLVETVAGSGRLAVLGPALLEELGLPFTGTSSEGMVLSANKLLTKKVLASEGLFVPPLWTEEGPAGGAGEWRGPWIVKSVWEHASIGIDDGSVVNAEQVPATLAARRRGGGGWFAEGFVEGREINLALVADGRGPEALPPAEIRFEGYPPGKPRIVGYPAKWAPGSFEYTHALRCFDFPHEDRDLLARLEVVARRCWEALGLAGYARVDVRVDRAGRPWVIDVNANPCLAPDAGFVANAERAGLDFSALIARIVEAGRAAAAPAAAGDEVRSARIARS